MKQKINLGGGCFWCTEAVYSMISGIHSVTPGYMDGHLKNPRYKDVCTGNSGHNEIVQIEFDDSIISLEEILDIFWTSHDPTTLNRQGADKGTQYRSGIYYESEAQKEIAEHSKAEVAPTLWEDPIVTEISPLVNFYPAEDYHQDYERLNPNQPYIRSVSVPRLNRFKSKYPELLKKDLKH